MGLASGLAGNGGAAAGGVQIQAQTITEASLGIATSRSYSFTFTFPTGVDQWICRAHGVTDTVNGTVYDDGRLVYTFPDVAGGAPNVVAITIQNSGGANAIRFHLHCIATGH